MNGIQTIASRLNRKSRQNYLLRQPLQGALILFVWIIGFALLYQPLGTHPGRHFGYTGTMALYGLSVAFVWPLLVWVIKRFRYFGLQHQWTISRELLSMLVCLSGVGLTVYLAGFLFELPGDRLNINTLMASVSSGFLAALIPFAFFSSLHMRQWFFPEELLYDRDQSGHPAKAEKLPGDQIVIPSRLKKEKLLLDPAALLYAESDGNYVVFYTLGEKGPKRHILRLPITEAEEHLSKWPHLMRVHRAFIVNLKAIRSMKGNTLGYKLRFPGIDAEIPVSRAHARAFMTRFEALTP